MRADRLLSILLILQTRGRTTAQELAEEMEVSERTIYRDITALCTAGVPVYTERGPGGGISLVESYRTDLTGLSNSEARALLMLSIPAPLADLGVGAELRAALLKLSASLPESRRQEESHIRQRLHLDSSWWQQGDQALPHLETIRQAVWEDRWLRTMHLDIFEAEVWREVKALGLVAKANVWYLIWETEGRRDATPITNLQQARMLNRAFERDPGFDLPAFWAEWCRQYEAKRAAFPVRLRLAPKHARMLRWSSTPKVRSQIDLALKANPDQWIEITIPFEHFEHARSRILGWGAAAEVLSPRALRDSIADFAQQTTLLYKPPAP